MFGDRLKDIRKKAGLKQSDLARQLGLERSTIAKYEVNASTPPDDIKIRIANIFNVSLDYLLCQTDNPDRAGEESALILSGVELEMVAIFRALSTEGQSYIRQQLYIAQQIYKKADTVSGMEAAEVG